ncbi:MAG: hypothetical protein AAF623_14975 [Planctomycetota bacterium]
MLLIALFFKFNRFWSVRNLDLLLIILLAPGLLLIDSGQAFVQQQKGQTRSQAEGIEDVTQTAVGILPKVSQFENLDDRSTGNPSSFSEPGSLTRQQIAGQKLQRFGYYWLFSAGIFLLIRMLIDPALTRRPMLEPNLTVGGLVFLGVSLMSFLMANIATSQPTPDDLQGAKDAVKLIKREQASSNDMEKLKRRGPGYRLFNLLPIIPSFESGDEILRTNVEQESDSLGRYVIAARSLAIVSQLLIVFGLVLFCHYYYENFYVGVGIGTIYLLLPYTALYTGHVSHALPAALLVWSLFFFRTPVAAGVLMGLATGVSYYPVFLIPLWASFYWDRGVKRFSVSFLVSILLCVGGLAFTSVDVADFMQQVRAMFGFWQPLLEGLDGVWALGWSQWWRLPILVTFVLFSISFVFWPTEKNIGTLVAYTGAVMIAVQFWHGFGGGLYVAWYMPMVLLTFFRPNLLGRVATQELREQNRKRKETAEDILVQD